MTEKNIKQNKAERSVNTKQLNVGLLCTFANFKHINSKTDISEALSRQLLGSSVELYVLSCAECIKLYMSKRLDLIHLKCNPG